MMRALILTALLSGAAAAQTPAATAGQDYAVAACLTAQAAGPLRDEGFLLGQVAVGGGSPLDFAPISSAVKAELARRPMTRVHTDAPVDQNMKPAVVAHCLAVSRAAPVRAAIAAVGKRR
jgi:hypothetical protein